MRPLLSFAFVVLWAAVASGDDQAPAPPVAGQVTLTVVPSPPLPPAATPTPQAPPVQAIATAQSPPVQAIAASPQGGFVMASTASQSLTLQTINPGPLRRMIGAMGASMARQEQPVFVPVTQAAPALVVAPAAAPAPAPVATVVPVSAMVVSPRPALFHRGSIFPLWR